MSYRIVSQQEVTSITCCLPNQSMALAIRAGFANASMHPSTFHFHFQKTPQMSGVDPYQVNRDVLVSPSTPPSLLFSFPSSRTMDYGDVSGWTSDQFSLHYDLPLNPYLPFRQESSSSLLSTCSDLCLTGSDITTSITSYTSGFLTFIYT